MKTHFLGILSFLLVIVTLSITLPATAQDGDERPVVDYDQMLTAHADGYEDAVAELEELGIIPEGGRLIFEEDYAFFTGAGAWFTSLAAGNPQSDIVMAGEITYTPSDSEELETCSFSSRIGQNSRGAAITFVDVGLTNQGILLALDLPEQGEVANLDVVDVSNLRAGETVHLLYILVDDRLNVYLDGELVITDFEVVDRRGSYGVALLGRGSDARCEGQDMWVYQVPIATGTLNCSVQAIGNVNRRTGPGTTFQTDGQMLSGESAKVDGQARGAGGFTWWRLAEDEVWVRSDTVNETGNCTEAPFIDDAS